MNWEKTQEEKLRETKTKEKKWGHDKVRALANSGSIVHSSLLHLSSQGRSARVCSWITATVWSSITNDTARVCMCWVARCVLRCKKYLVVPTTLGAFRAGTLTICNLMYCSLCRSPSQPPLCCTWQLTNVNSEPFRLRGRELFRLEMGSLFPLGLLFHTTIYKKERGGRGWRR